MAAVKYAPLSLYCAPVFGFEGEKLKGIGKIKKYVRRIAVGFCGIKCELQLYVNVDM